MGMVGNTGGQRNDMGSGSGRKERSPTMTTHSSSRAEPSHVQEKAHDDAAKTRAAKELADAKEAEARKADAKPDAQA